MTWSASRFVRARTTGEVSSTATVRHFSTTPTNIVSTAHKNILPESLPPFIAPVSMKESGQVGIRSSPSYSAFSLMLNTISRTASCLRVNTVVYHPSISANYQSCAQNTRITHIYIYQLLFIAAPDITLHYLRYIYRNLNHTEKIRTLRRQRRNSQLVLTVSSKGG